MSAVGRDYRDKKRVAQNGARQKMGTHSFKYTATAISRIPSWSQSPDGANAQCMSILTAERIFILRAFRCVAVDPQCLFPQHCPHRISACHVWRGGASGRTATPQPRQQIRGTVNKTASNCRCPGFGESARPEHPVLQKKREWRSSTLLSHCENHLYFIFSSR
jgi:hypothetical protein